MNADSLKASPQWAIHDLYVYHPEAEPWGQALCFPLLDGTTPLLYRVGYLDFLRLGPQARTPLRVRVVADEVWALLEGQAHFYWRDLRSTSPTRDQEQSLTLAAPALVLVPFGVAFGVHVEGETALLMRVSTHPPGSHPEDHELPWTPGHEPESR